MLTLNAARYQNFHLLLSPWFHSYLSNLILYRQLKGTHLSNLMYALKKQIMLQRVLNLLQILNCWIRICLAVSFDPYIHRKWWYLDLQEPVRFLNTFRLYHTPRQLDTFWILLMLHRNLFEALHTDELNHSDWFN